MTKDLGSRLREVKNRELTQEEAVVEIRLILYGAMKDQAPQGLYEINRSAPDQSGFNLHFAEICMRWDKGESGYELTNPLIAADNGGGYHS